MIEIPLSGIKKIEEIAQSSSDFVSLSQGSIKIGGIPQEVKAYVQSLLNTDKTDYYESCWGIRALRDKLAATLNAQYGVHLTANNVIPTHGCIGGLSLLYMTLLSADDEIIIPEPAYPAYHILAQATRSKPVFVSCVASEGSAPYAFNLAGIKAATTPKTKMIIFSNPFNPLGIIVSPTDLEELVRWCDERGIYLVVDEAYRSYVFDGAYLSAINLLAKSPFVVCANSFSKNMAMSGWRIGYLLVHEKLAHALVGMQDALLNCLNNTAQYAALYALDHPELTDAMHKVVRNNRDQALHLLEPLTSRGILTTYKPAGGFFLLLKTDQADATDLCMSIVHTAKVGLIPGKSFGPSSTGSVRLCYAREPEVLEEGIRRLVNYFL